MAYALPTLNSGEWNRLMVRIQAGLAVGYSRRSPGRAFRHPWNVQARYNPFSDAWELNVAAGFVNGAETLAPAVPRELAPPETLARVAGTPEATARTVRPWLSESPWIPVRQSAWRRIGTDADPARDPEPVPEWFAALGVGGGSAIGIAGDLSGVTVSPAAANGPPEERRLLRAIDLLLSIPVPSPAVAITTDGEGLALADVSLAVPAPGARPAVSIVDRWTRRTAAPSLVEQLATGATGATVAEYAIATLYLLSPAGAVAGSVPAGDWVPFSAAVLCWNLAFAWRSTLADTPRFRLAFTSGLSGGAGDSIFASLLAPNNAADAAAALALSRAAVETGVWSV